MKISDVLKLKIVDVPFPVAVSGVQVVDGRVGAHVKCATSCVERECVNAQQWETARICSKSLRYHVYSIGDDLVCIYGLAPYNAGVGKNSDLKGRGFPQDFVSAWVGSVRELVNEFTLREGRSRAEALDSLHDISRMALEVSRISEKIIDRSGGLEKAGALELSLLKASELLVGEFDRIELLINPASAAAGSRYTHVYKLCHKIVQIIDIAMCRPNNKRIKMIGRSDMTLRLYESVSTLAFALIENSAKHAFSNSDVIYVELSDSAGCVEISVTSVGPVIESSEIANVFDKGFRGRWAQRRTEGRGVGLFLARIVADAHRTKILVESTPLGYERESVPVARNNFSVKLREV